MTTPASWEGANSRTLAEIVNQPTNQVINSVAAGAILLNEVGADFLPRNGRLSSNVNSAAIMTFATSANTLKNASLRRVLGIGLLGGYDYLTKKKYTPYQHPYFPGMFAKDIVDVQFISPDAPTQFDTTYNASVAIITVSFETLPYWVGVTTSANDDYNMNYCSWRVKATNQKVTNPTGYYAFSDKVPALFGTYKNMPTQWIELTMYQVPAANLWIGGVDTVIPRSLIASGGQWIGWVNDAAFAGVLAKRLLLDSMETSEMYHHWLGYELYNVKFNLIYNDWGWNNQPRPVTNDLDELGSIFNFNVKPFPLFDMKLFFLNRNPIPAAPQPPGPPIPMFAGA